MKKLFYLLLLLLVASCEKDSFENGITQVQNEREVKQEFVSIEDVPEIIPAIVNYNPEYQYLYGGSNPVFSSRDGDTLSLDLDLEHILKVVDVYGKESYSISIKKAFSENEDIFFENLYLYEKGDQVESLIFRYTQSDIGEDFKTETFTGLMEIFNKDRGLIGHIEFENGEKKHVKWVLDFGCWQLYLSTENYTIYDGCGSSGGGSNEHSGEEGYYGSDGGYGGSGSGIGHYYPTPNPSDPTLQNHHTVVPNTNWPESIPLASAIFKVYKKIGQNNPAMNTWLQEHPEDALTFYEFLRYQTQNEAFVTAAKELLIMAWEEAEDPEAVSNLLYMSLYSQEHGHLGNTSFDINYYNYIDNFVEADLSDPITIVLWQAHFKARCAILKRQNPNWSMPRIYWEASKEMFHLGLDLLGLVPIFGEVADLTNGVVYAIEGDGVNATLSSISAIPLAGWFTASTKLGYKIVNAASDTASRTTLKWLVKADGTIIFGATKSARSQLRKVLNITSPALQAHHIIPWSLGNHWAIQKAAKSPNAFHMNEALNGIPLSNSIIHNGSHPDYNSLVSARLSEINPNLSPQQTYQQVLDLISDIKIAIQNNPGTPVNQLMF